MTPADRRWLQLEGFARLDALDLLARLANSCTSNEAREILHHAWLHLQMDNTHRNNWHWQKRYQHDDPR